MNKQFFHLPKNISLRFRDYSLRTKLLLAFLAVTIIPLVVVFYLNNRSTTQSLTDNANIALSGAAAQTAATLDTFIATGLDNARVAAQSYIWEEYLALPPAERTGSESEQVLYIDLRALASLDQTYIDAVGLMDKNGIDVADTAKGDVGSNKSTHRYVAEPLRTGLPYSTVQFSPTSHKLSLYFSAPVHDANGNIIGVLRIRYNESVLQSILIQSAAKAGIPDGAVDLLDENHIFLGSTDGPSEILKTVALLPADKLAQLQAELRLPEGSAESFSLDLPDLEQDLNHTDQQPIFTIETEGEEAAVAPLKNQPWVVMYAQPQSTYLAPLTAQTRTAIVTALIIAVLAAAAAVFVSQFLTGPLVRLAAVAEQVAAGDINVQAKVESADESGTLAAAFNNMTSRLRELIGSLEQGTQRLEQGTQSLKLAAEVGHSVSQVRELDVMLRDATELIRSRFDLYYTQVYLADASQTNLILQSGTGSVGAELISRSHRLPLNSGSINGRAATEKRSVVIADTAASATFRPNPLLPDTRSEMAVPLLIGEKVVGVLDLQSKQVGALTEEFLPAFEALAGQLAIAIQNANLLAETEQARAEVEKQAARSTRANWQDYLDAIHQPEQTGFLYDQNKIVPLIEDFQTPADANTLTAPISITGESLGTLVVEMAKERQSAQATELVNIVARQVAQQIESLRLLENAERYRAEAEEASRRLTREGWKDYLDANVGRDLSYIYDLKEVRAEKKFGNGGDGSAVGLPLKIRDETIGKLAVSGLDSNDTESIELANAVVERLGAHIESLRQYDQTQSALAQSEKLFNASRRLTQATDLQELVKATIETLGIREVNRAILCIFEYSPNDELNGLTIIANWWNGTGHAVTPIGTPDSIEMLRVLPLFISPTPVFFNDTLDDERVDATTLEVVKGLNLRAVAVMPLHLGSRQTGALILESEEMHNFTQDETRLFTALAPQVATVVESRRQYEKAQHQAERESMLNAISQKIQGATTVEAALQIAARELGRALGAPRTIAQLGLTPRDDDGNGRK